MKGSKTSSLYSSRQWVEVLNCLLNLNSENWQEWMILDVWIASEIKAKTQVQAIKIE